MLVNGAFRIKAAAYASNKFWDKHISDNETDARK
jgi:hypothetical protein